MSAPLLRRDDIDELRKPVVQLVGFADGPIRVGNTYDLVLSGGKCPEWKIQLHCVCIDIPKSRVAQYREAWHLLLDRSEDACIHIEAAADAANPGTDAEVPAEIEKLYRP